MVNSARLIRRPPAIFRILASWARVFGGRTVAVLGLLAVVAVTRTAGSVGYVVDPESRGVLAAYLDPFLAQHDLGTGQLAAFFCDGATGQVLYARHEHLALKPASNNKLLTTAVALHYLGRDFRYQTLVATRGVQRGETLEGDLVVVGSGDPSISGRFVPNHDRTAVFRRWAEMLGQRGIRRITGDIVGIDDFFDDQGQAPGWPDEERGEWYCAEVSALAFNDSCVDLRWMGAKTSAKEPAAFDLIPPTKYVQIVNFVTTTKDKGPHERYYERPATSNVITVRGRVASGEEVFDSATVSNPTLYFVTVLAETLRAAGIEVKGAPHDADEYADKSIFHRSLEPLTIHKSPPLLQLIEVVNCNSHNFYAEQILKTLGKKVVGEGSFDAGTRVVRRYLETNGVDCRGLRLVDGSGLSRFDRVTPAQLVAVLRTVDQTPDGPLFRETLPQGGKTGSLRKRFQGDVGLRKAGPRVRAKTGYIRGCHSLSGWLETRAGQSICFSVLCNDLPMTDDETKLFIERLVTRVANLNKKQ